MTPLTTYDLDRLTERRSAKWRAFPPDVLPLWVAEMDAPLAEPVAAALSAAVTRGDTGYPAPGRLPEAFAGYAADRWGWWPDPAGIDLVPDVMSGIVETLRQVTEPGGRVVVTTPAYPPFLYWVRRIGRTLVTSPLGDDGLDLGRLERDFAAGADAYLLCSPHNPTGRVFGRDELLAVASLADRYGVAVVADEIHAPLTYPGVRHVPFASLDTDASARSYTVVSASKGWNLPGLKAALVVRGRAATARVPAEVSEQTGLFGVIACEAAYTHGRPWLAELLADLDANRHLLDELLATHLPGVSWRVPDATYLAWLDCRALGLGDDPAETFLHTGRVAFARGPRFGRPGHGFARLNFATNPRILTEAVHRISATTAP